MKRSEFTLRLVVEGTVAPSEESDKVLRAIENVLGNCVHKVEKTPGAVRVVSEDPRCLDLVRDQLRDRRVRATARRLFLANAEGKRTTVMLNRQAAFAGVVVLCGSESESPLGPLYMTAASEELESLIEWLTAYSSG
jgi:predicted RNA binding protein with dsRBD fold (UPF0201 family)